MGGEGEREEGGGGMAQEKVTDSEGVAGVGEKTVNGRKRQLVKKTAPHGELTCTYSCEKRWHQHCSGETSEWIGNR